LLIPERYPGVKRDWLMLRLELLRLGLEPEESRPTPPSQFIIKTVIIKTIIIVLK